MNAFQMRGPSTSSMMVIVTIVTTAATMAAMRVKSETIGARPCQQVKQTTRRDRPDTPSTWKCLSRNESGPPGSKTWEARCGRLPSRPFA